MAPGDALDDEMRRHPRNSVPPLDADTAERMLDGALDPQDAPPDYRDVLRVLAAASAPASADSSAEAAALAMFRSARRPVDTPRRTSVLSKLLGAKALAALALATASVGTAAAAATGTLPDAAQAAVHRVVAAAPDADRGDQAAAGGAAKANARSAADPVGLCRAYAAGRGGEQGGKLDAVAFERLTAAAGKAGVDSYCATVMAGARAGSAAHAAGAKADAALVGQCRSWLAAEQQGSTAALGKAVLDRLAAAAGGADQIAAYCADLAEQASADQGPGVTTDTRPSTAKAPESPGAGAPGQGASTSHPVAPTPTPRG
jgi:hypothetical protein